MSNLEVKDIVGFNSEPVYFPTGISGFSDALTFEPQVLEVAPENKSEQVAISTNITITFDRDIVPSSDSNGVIELRRDAIGGTLIESFSIGVSGVDQDLTLSGNQLIINPSSDLLNAKKYYVILPSTGISDSATGAKYKGGNYNFFTEWQQLVATGGNFVYTKFESNSPTNYYRYHVFTGSGGLTLNVPSYSSPDFRILMVGGGGAGGNFSPTLPFGGGCQPAGGGGGAGAVITGPARTIANIPGPSTYVITVGSGGVGRTAGVRIPIDNTTTNGTDTKISKPASDYEVVAKGGGGGGGCSGPPGQSEEFFPESVGKYGGSGGGAAWNGSFRPPSSPMTSSYLSYIQQFGGIDSSYTGGESSSHGNPGGGSRHSIAGLGSPTTRWVYGLAGGGGGAGSSGSNGSSPVSNRPIAPPYTWPAAPHPSTFYGDGGNGGNGLATGPVFRGPQLDSTDVPGLPPASRSAIGPTGLYGGGGGGGVGGDPTYNNTTNSNLIEASSGGPGGGGHGANNNGPAPTNPPGFAPLMPQPYEAQPGYQHTGGGGGGSGDFPTAPTVPVAAGNGGSGFFVIAYAYPGP
jgi:hypothetical protein